MLLTVNGKPMQPPAGLKKQEIVALTIDLLLATADQDNTYRPLNYTHTISVDRVLANAWNEGRLKRASQLLAEGHKAPPIHVNRLIWRGEAFYIVTDGNHRTVAARLASQERITARLYGEATCIPDLHFLLPNEHTLVRYSHNARSGKHMYKRVSHNWDANMYAFALAAGIKILQ